MKQAKLWFVLNIMILILTQNQSQLVVTSTGNSEKATSMDWSKITQKSSLYNHGGIMLLCIGSGGICIHKMGIMAKND